MALVQTIKEQAYDIILKKILTKDYSPGSRINIGNLSRELGISNSPIREALNLLEQQGLVVSIPNRGINVVAISQRDLFELSQMLLFLELGSYDYCVEYDLTEKMCHEMEAVIKTQKMYFEEKNEYEFTYYANQFDRCIIAATGNSRLLTQFDNLAPLIFLGSLYNQAEGYQSWQICLNQHEKILSAIKEHRRDDAIAAISEHHYKPIWDLRGSGAKASE